jgi:hypothetical protein
VLNFLAGSQSLIKLHKGILGEVLSEFIVGRRPESIADQEHIPAVKERCH